MNHRWLGLHLAGRTLAVALRAVPRRHRFAAALWVSARLRGIIQRTAVYREEAPDTFDTIAEIALYHVLRMMTEHGTEFDLRFSVEGAPIASVLPPGDGVLIIAPHAMLGTLIPRFVYDHGRVPTMIALNPHFRLSGTTVPASAVRPSASYLIGIRGTLRSGGVVCAMIDQPEIGYNSRTREFKTARGQVRVTDGLIRLAIKCGARIVFTCVRVDGRRVVATFDVPSPGAAGSAEGVTGDFIRFVEAHAAAVPQSHGRDDRRATA